MVGAEEDATVVQRLVTRLRVDPDRYDAPAVPHPLAATLTLPDGTPAPAGLRHWAAFDRRLPLYLAAAPSDLAIADDDGVALVTPMVDVLREVCLDSIVDELDEEPETVRYLEDLIRQYATEYPGFGVVLAPRDHPERILWLGPAGTATVLVYEDDRLDGTPWGVWLRDLFDP